MLKRIRSNGTTDVEHETLKCNGGAMNNAFYRKEKVAVKMATVK